MDVQQDRVGTRPSALIQAYRRASGLTQQELADRSGLSVATVRDLEQGRSRRPRSKSLTALANALGLSAEESAELAAAGGGARPAAETSPPAGHGSGLWLAVLGPIAAWRDGVHLGLGAPQQAAVLGLLALQPGRLVRRQAIIEALWGHQPPATAADLVQTHVGKLRRVLDPDGHGRLIAQGTAGYRLRAVADVLDVAAFGDLAGRAGAAADPAEACGLYARALELWRGEPAADAEVLRDHPAVADLARRRMQAVLRYADTACGLGWYARVIPLLEALAWEQPLDERVHARLIVALAGTGQQVAAVKVHGELLRRLDEELAVRPGPEVTAAYQRVLRQDIPPAADENTTAANGPVTRSRAHSALGVRYSLPPDTPAFTGRQAELDRITAPAVGSAGTGGLVAMHAISGMPGVGKTALAVHAAHVLKDRFPDRQLFLPLHGHTPGQDPVAPEAALAGLLTAVGVDTRYLPDDLDGRSALWRDRMAGQKALLVLDNAASSAQVTPLLPGQEGCLVLVTSRRHLADLPGGAAPVLLGALSPPEARAMFTQLAPRTAIGLRENVAELAELAGRLPLAIALLARVYARHPSWTLADLAAETQAGMLTLTAENDSVAAAFAVSFRHLEPSLQEFFRHLGQHPGTTIDGYAAAALIGSGLEEAAGQLDALHGEGLLTETGYRRYDLHDLIRRYARDLAAADPADHRERALDRLLDYYQHAAARAEALLARQARTSRARCPHPVPSMTDAAQALSWARAERASLLACLDQATAAGQNARVVALTAAMASLLRLDGPWNSAITLHATAVTAARQAGDRLGQANALTDLGSARRLTGDHHGAVEALQEALDIYRDTGDRQGQATALISLADVWLATGEHHSAIKALHGALDVYPSIGSRLGQATALTDLRGVRRLTRDHHSAVEALREALSMYRDVNDRQGQATVLTFLGVVRLAAGDHRDATEALQEALNIYRSIGHRLGTATALTYLGDARRTTGDHRDATEALQEALNIYRSIGDRGGEAMALNQTGTLHRANGDSGQAAQCHRRALDLAREITSAWDEAHALAGLGRCALAIDRIADATARLEQARDIFQRIGAAETAGIVAELKALDLTPHPKGGRVSRAVPWGSLQRGRRGGTTPSAGGSLVSSRRICRCGRCRGSLTRSHPS